MLPPKNTANWNIFTVMSSVFGSDFRLLAVRIWITLQPDTTTPEGSSIKTKSHYKDLEVLFIFYLFIYMAIFRWRHIYLLYYYTVNIFILLIKCTSIQYSNIILDGFILRMIWTRPLKYNIPFNTLLFVSNINKIFTYHYRAIERGKHSWLHEENDREI